jgi:hypothetical protein
VRRADLAVTGDIYRLALHRGAQPGLQGVGRDEIHPLAPVILQEEVPLWVGTARISVTGTTVAAAAGSGPATQTQRLSLRTTRQHSPLDHAHLPHLLNMSLAPSVAQLWFGSQWRKPTLAYAYAAWVDPSRNSIDLGGRKRPFDDSIEQAIARS